VEKNLLVNELEIGTNYNIFRKYDDNDETKKIAAI